MGIPVEEATELYCLPSQSRSALKVDLISKRVNQFLTIEIVIQQY